MGKESKKDGHSGLHQQHVLKRELVPNYNVPTMSRKDQLICRLQRAAPEIGLFSRVIAAHSQKNIFISYLFKPLLYQLIEQGKVQKQLLSREVNHDNHFTG